MNMSEKLTVTLIKSLQPQNKDYIAWDRDLKGFGIRVKPTGVKSYLIQYRNTNRRSRRFTLGRTGEFTPAAAREFAAKKLAEVRQEQDPAEKRKLGRSAPNISTLCERYLIEHAKPHKKASSYREDKRLIEKHIKPKIGSLKIEAVTKSDIIKIHHEMENTPYIANRLISLLSKIFNLSEAWGLRPDGSNPAHHIKRYKEKKRERFLDKDELATLGKTLNAIEKTRAEYPDAITAIRLLIFTGCRVSEILSLEWNWINFETGSIRLPDSKTGSKTIYLGTALSLLENTERKSKYVIPSKMNKNKPMSTYVMDDIWHRIRERAGLKDVRLHDLRHTYASWAVMSGYGLPMTGALLGHSSISTTQRYAHLSNDPLKQAAEEISGNLQKMLLG